MTTTSFRDPRARRTLERLRGAMVSLMATKNLDEIGVAELCREAGVHRTTFYKHFTSVTGFATQVFGELIDEVAPAAVEEDAKTVEDLDRGYRESVLALLRHVHEDRATYRRLFSSHGDLEFQRIFADRMIARAAAALAALERFEIAPTTDHDTAAAMVGMSLAGAVTVWAGQEGGDAEARAEEIVSSFPRWWPSVG